METRSLDDLDSLLNALGSLVALSLAIYLAGYVKHLLHGIVRGLDGGKTTHNVMEKMFHIPRISSRPTAPLVQQRDRQALSDGLRQMCCHHRSGNGEAAVRSSESAMRRSSI